jgi:hypothetical protein
MELLTWLPTAAISALGFVLWKKLDGQSDKIEEIHEMMRTELRTMDVRIARIESLLWPDRQHHNTPI